MPRLSTAVVALLLTACSTGAQVATPTPIATPTSILTAQPTPSQVPSPTRTITGTFVLSNGEPVNRPTQGITWFVNPKPPFLPCSGTGGFSDIQTGLQVTVKDASGSIIGLGRLDDDIDATETNSRIENKVERGGILNHCYHKFLLADLPESPFYSVEVGRRGGVSNSLSELEALDWHLELSIGR